VGKPRAPYLPGPRGLLEFTMGSELMVKQEVLQKVGQVKCTEWEDCALGVIRAVREIVNKYGGDIPLVVVTDESVRIAFYVKASPSKFAPIDVTGLARRCGDSICVSPTIN